MAEIPEVEGEVLLTNKKYPALDIRRGEETLPCFNNHVIVANQWVREDIVVIADTLAWCPCGNVYRRKEALVVVDGVEDTSQPPDWQLMGDTR